MLGGLTWLGWLWQVMLLADTKAALWLLAADWLRKHDLV
jgi:hypothetical protein